MVLIGLEMPLNSSLFSLSSVDRCGNVAAMRFPMQRIGKQHSLSHELISAALNASGFKMVLRVDNNRCSAEVFPVKGDVTPDANCGFHNYNDRLTDEAGICFQARHPNNFATYDFVVRRATGDAVASSRERKFLGLTQAGAKEST